MNGQKINLRTDDSLLKETVPDIPINKIGLVGQCSFIVFFFSGLTND